ncbi:MAG: undecaprenyldiphospho-muramoylpentapeptide beta-N-acetylglucosaminyltransferase [Pseudomonadota bacterium]
MSGPVLIMAGGTGGHIFPGLAVAGELRERNVDVLWLGSAHGMENTLVPQHELPLETIAVSGLRGRGWLPLLAAPFRLAGAVWAALRIVRRHRPRSVLSMGGFAAGPGGVAAWLSRRPLVVHEQNAIPGLTNRLLARFARRVLAGFPQAFPRGENVGNPVRPSIAALPAPARRLAGARESCRVLVLGGSQGARSLNQTVPRALEKLANPNIKVRHQCGRAAEAETRQAYAALADSARVESFIADMAEAYGWADLVICRAGALTVAELAAAGVASVLVPFPHAVDDHQTHNARFLADAGAAVLMPENELTAAALAEQLAGLASQRERLLEMAQRARSLARTDATRRVADVCLEVGA